MSTEAQTFSFQAEVTELLHLVVNSLYSHKEIFVRELVSNASDAIDRLKFQALTDKELLGDAPAEIRLVPNREAGTLTIEDTGVGMTHDELVKNLGTIAHSGSRAFIQRVHEAGNKDVNLIGQFGVGFYSAFLVADHVDVVSRAAGSTEAWRWSSDAKSAFTMEPAERPEAGTSVVMHLKEEQKQYLDEWELKELVRRYSDYVSHPIKLKVEGKDELETINRASALWQRPKAEITDEQYEEFYKHVAHDFEAPLARNHFRIEGTQLFTGLLYVPKRAPYDLYMREHRRGVRLYVKRVFVMEDCEDLVPVWLRFVRGVIDSDDLPLNVSRELLQDSALVKTIKKQVSKKTLDLLEELARDKQDDYRAFWETFGSVVKEGMHFDPEFKDRIAALCRFESSKEEGLTSLTDYVKRMPEGQGAIYVIVAESRAAAAGSPHLEALKKRGYEVLYLTDAVDEWVLPSLREFEGKPVVNALHADLKLDETDAEKKAHEDTTGALKEFTDAVKTVLGDRVKEVRVSTRLTDSPACLVVPDGGLTAHLERLLRAHDKETPIQKRIFEVNPDHPLALRLKTLAERAPGSERFAEWVEVLYDQALLTEGSPLPDPHAFARRVTKLLEAATAVAVDG